MHLFISAGEPSGDLHGSNLICMLKRIDPTIRFSGFGGDKMQAAGCTLLYPLTKLAVMWFLQAILNIFTFMRLLGRAKRFLREEKPDAVILIDYPGFNFALAKRAHSLGVPVIYFVPPQLWAWAGWRVKKMQKWVSTVLSALPFEHKWYVERGVDSVNIGHPYFDELADQELNIAFLADERQKSGRIVGILPGSRMQEVTKNLPDMLIAAGRVHQEVPDTRFLVACFNEAQADLARKMTEGSSLPVEVCVQRTPEIIELSTACIAVSGSVSLEIMYRLKPTIIVYRVGKLGLRVGRWFMQCKYITLVNLLAEEMLFPEFLCDRSPAVEVADVMITWLNDSTRIDEIQKKLKQLRDRVANPGACERAARLIYERCLPATASHPPVAA